MIRDLFGAFFVALLAASGPVLAADAPVAPTPQTTLGHETPVESRFQLLMIEQVGCVYCRMWNHDLAPIYPKTPEGKTAPLRRADLHQPMPADVTLTGGRVIYTPTFVLLDNGTEVGRIEGYASEDFFWGLLGQALQQAGAELPGTE